MRKHRNERNEQMKVGRKGPRIRDKTKNQKVQRNHHHGKKDRNEENSTDSDQEMSEGQRERHSDSESETKRSENPDRERTGKRGLNGLDCIPTALRMRRDFTDVGSSKHALWPAPWKKYRSLRRQQEVPCFNSGLFLHHRLGRFGLMSGTTPSSPPFSVQCFGACAFRAVAPNVSEAPNVFGNRQAERVKQ